ncbi:hypothetical protein HPB49_017708 [Dermacentor silvarum]|uniref:Uncharacterized protein n=1 Tax=Dermacentor silvarum TaxID=543639 RepID=A0ACB8DQN4_DERSI|nr:hypothetical protein HPB49_017708 [Dermacentor silvarum]
MSDGEHNTGLSIADVKPRLLAAKVQVTTIALGPTADNQLEELAIATGGKAYAFQDLRGRTIPSIEEAFSVATNVQLNEHARVVTGTWTLLMKSPSSSVMGLYIEVKSQARNASEAPIRVVCEVTTPLVHVPDLVIYAHVNKGDKVVLYADAVAEVSGPNLPRLSTTRLRDDGCYPDITANDGTYSGYFTAYTGPGRYAVMARVQNKNTAILADPVLGPFGSPSNTVLHSDDGIGDQSSSEYLIDDFDLFDSSDESPTMVKTSNREKLEPFERTAIGGSFQVAANIYEKDLPPLGVLDLRVTFLRQGENGTLLVNVTWTCPGAHLTSGNASFAEIRIGNDYEELISSFDEQTEITDADVVDGSLTPLPSCAKHAVTVLLPATFSTTRADGELIYNAFLAVRFGNSEGLKSNISNIVRVHHVPPPRIPTVDGVINKLDKETVLWWIWMFVAGGLVVFAVLTTMLVIVLMKTNPRKSDIYTIFARKRQQTGQDPA